MPNQNKLIASLAFESVSWAKGQSSIPVTTDIAPNGTATARRFADTVDNGAHYIYPLQFVANTQMATISCYCKAVTRNWVVLGGNGGAAVSWFNLLTGTLGSVSGSAAITSAINPVGNGWYRCSFTYLSNAAVPIIYTATADGVASYIGDGSYIDIWGAQLEQSNTMGDYVYTNGTAYDIGAPRNKAYPQNLQPYSQDFSNALWTKYYTTRSTTTGPDNSTISRIYETADTNYHQIYSVNSKLLGTYTFSVWIHGGTRRYANLTCDTGIGNIPNATFDLETGIVGYVSGSVTKNSIVSLGSGWYKISITFTSQIAYCQIVLCESSATIGSYVGNVAKYIDIWRVQLERSNYAGDYIIANATSYDLGNPRNIVAGQNIIKQSQALATTPWGNDGTATVSNNYATAPDGTTTASRVQFAAGGGIRYVYANSASITYTNGYYTISAWLRATSSAATMRFRLPSTPGVLNNVSSDIVLDTTWRRYSFTSSVTITASAISDALIQNDVAVSAADFLVWGVQLVKANHPGDYMATTTASIEYSIPRNTSA
jgi:hypothetical protein